MTNESRLSGSILVNCVELRSSPISLQHPSFSSRGISFSNIMPGSQTPFIHRIQENVRKEENIYISHVTPSRRSATERRLYQLQAATSADSIGVAESVGRVASTSGEVDEPGAAL